MLSPCRLAVAFALGGALLPAEPAPSRAQSATDLADVCKAVGEAKLGQWASYDAVKHGGGGGRIRLAVVGSERSGDTTLYWFEVNFSGADPGQSMTWQVLNPTLADGMAAPHAVIVKWGAQPAMKLPRAMASTMGQKAGGSAPAFAWAARCHSAQIVGWESVSVPAGTYRALHLTIGDGVHVWGSRDIPFGFVKMQGKDGDLALTAHGADAKSSITEKPSEMPGFMTKP